MKTIGKLFDKLDEMETGHAAGVAEVTAAIQQQLNAVYDDWKELQDAVRKLVDFDGVEYCANEYGDVEAWIRFYPLADVPEREREFLETYLDTIACTTVVDWDNETLSQSVGGDDEIFINADGRRGDRGVYQGHKQIISEDDYTDDDGEVNEDLRNQLIENHMERTGYFPGVYLTNNHDNHLIPVSTKRKG